ncbi:MAG: type II toxin-antitoxin system VapC family toxin [Nostocaceae cyanobacterium]|nr:type II toxin-antitoxin system VapC family toxin [Nostocaceae cyanobacterium]
MTCYVMDTDHLSLYERAQPKVCDRIIRTRQHYSDTLFTTVVSLEEQYAGRIAQIRKATTDQALVGAYDKFKQIFALFSDLDILEYDLKANEYFREFRRDGIRIGTLDLRIAAITLANGGILLSRNQKDFEKVPGLTIQNWSA